MLDYTFARLGLANESSVSHPIIMTEAVACPEYSRSNMYELLFETYNVPNIGSGIRRPVSFRTVFDGCRTAFGIDSLFSYAFNASLPDQKLDPDVGVVVSSSYDVIVVSLTPTRSADILAVGVAHHSDLGRFGARIPIDQAFFRRLPPPGIFVQIHRNAGPV